MKRQFIVSVALLVHAMTIHAATEVIALQHRPAEDLLPFVQSALGNEGKADAYGSQLIINTTPDKLWEVRQLLNQLDTAPRQLLVSVDSSDSSITTHHGYSINGGANIGGTRIETGRGNQTRIISRSTGSQGGGVQAVQVTEGYPAMIQVGQSVPLTTSDMDPYGQRYPSTQYRDLTRGFYVTANVTGDTVHVTLSTNHDRMAPSSSQVINTQGAETRLSGRLGEWITIGGVNESATSDARGLLRQHSTRGRDDMTLRLKVDALD
ncbi:secretin N-terminal domain-containing protein [Pseudomonas sp. Marseille-QA0892]